MKTFKYFITENYVIESLNQPYELKLNKGDNKGEMEADVKLPDGSSLSIHFTNDYDEVRGSDITKVVFERGKSTEITGKGDAQRVFATVLAAIQQYVKKYKPKGIRFSASKDVEPGQNVNSRSSLYNRMVQRYAGTLGYQMSAHNGTKEVTYDLIQKKQNMVKK